MSNKGDRDNRRTPNIIVRAKRWALILVIKGVKGQNVSLTSDCQTSSGSVIAHWESDRARVSRGDTSECEDVHLTLSLDQVHFVIPQRRVLQFPLGQGGVLMRDQALKADVVTLVYDAALQEFQYFNLNLCLTNKYQQQLHIRWPSWGYTSRGDV